jgi:transposase
MDERLRLVAQLLDGEAMSEVCRAFGISRKTGYKIFERYKEHGLEALTDRSRRPVRYANQLPRQIESLIVAAKRDKPHWGARKIRELLVRRLDGDIRVPAKSTIHAVLHRHGLVKVPGRPRHRDREFEIQLPPAASHVRTCLSREFAFPRREAAVFRGCAGRGERHGRQRRAGRGNIGPTGGNISVGPYSGTAPPVMWAA